MIRIHIHSKSGLYNVESYSIDHLKLSTKNGSFLTSMQDFKCFAGGRWNIHWLPEHDAFQAHLISMSIIPDPDIKLKALKLQLDEIKESNEWAQQQAVEHDQEEEQERLDMEAFERQQAEWQQDQDIRERTPEYWKELYETSETKLNNLHKRLDKIGKELYRHLPLLPILPELQIHDGIKFIISEHHNTHEREFHFDPYRVGNNYHSNISDFNPQYSTLNGGWMKIIDKQIYLYAQSSDYGKYQDDVAIACAKKLFPTHSILSFAGKSWEQVIELTVQDDVPF